MSKLGLSLIETAARALRNVLTQFDLPYEIDEMDWREAWGELTKIGLYRFGPDVSHVGTTWLEGLVATGAVRPFTDEDVDLLGGESAFFPATWQSVLLPSGKGREVWAMPWLVDTRVVFYWRDILEKAGIDEKTAFATPAHVEETMARLQDSGADVPWGIWALRSGVTLQNAASWVWQTGGDFLSADGRQLLFDQPEAIEGFTAHLTLCRYMPPDIKSIDMEDHDVLRLFAERRTAVIMGLGGWLPYLLEQSGVPDMVNRLGVAAPPEPAFIGGSSLIIWRHARQVQDAVAAVRTLTSKQLFEAFLRERVQFFPARLDVWAEPPYADAPHYKAVAQAIKAGRTFPVASKWGMFETKLNQTIAEVWERALAAPDQDLTDLVSSYMRPLAARFAVSLGIRR